MRLERQSHCKVNLLLNILGKRPDGFHELETLMHPVWLHDELSFEQTGSSVALTCSDPSLPTDSGNLVFRAAASFLAAAGIEQGIKIHLEKKLPLAAGLGGGSGNAGTTLLALNEMFGGPLPAGRLQELAAALGSDVPFFLQQNPALAFGRGELIEEIPHLGALGGAAFIIVHPGFGISTPWAYKELAKYPSALNGTPGRARKLAQSLAAGVVHPATTDLYNSLEAPALNKYPLLQLYQEFFRAHGCASLMSGSGSSTFAIAESLPQAQQIAEEFRSKFGPSAWLATAPCLKPRP